jgi:adenylyltransferase/sulfurtransferase
VLPAAQEIAQRAKTLALSEPELARYSRHVLLPEVGLVGQKRLKAARILVVGVGGLGSPACLYLAAAGVGTIGLVDDDTVDASNLQRQVIFATSDTGAAKVDAAAARLRALNAQITVETHAARVTARNVAALVARYDIVVDGTDNLPTRYLVSDACVDAGKPYVYGSVHRFDGQVAVFYPPHGPCYRCLFPKAPPLGALPSCNTGGVLGVLPGLVGTTQAAEALKLALGVGAPLVGRLLTLDALGARSDELRLARDPQCRCARLEGRAEAAATPPPSLEQEPPVKAEMSVNEYQAMREKREPHLLLDVRRDDERAICKIEGGVSIPLDQLEERVDELPKDTTIVVYCRSGARSRAATQFLRESGYDRAINLGGGILAWIDAFEPTWRKY